jgi:hypothetical protein
MAQPATRAFLRALLGPQGRALTKQAIRQAATSQPVRSRVEQIGPVPARKGRSRRSVDALLGPLVQYGLVLTAVLAVFTLFDSPFDSLAGTGTWQAIVKLSAGGLLALVGALLLFDVHGARWLLQSRLLARAQARGAHPSGLLETLLWRARGPALVVIGFLWCAAGLLELARGIAELF